MSRSKRKKKRSLYNRAGDFMFLYVLGGIGKALEKVIGEEDAEPPVEEPPPPSREPSSPRP